MRSETACRKELELLEGDLKKWQAKFERATDPNQRIMLGATIAGVEGQIEALQWVLKGD